jgi:hypothetical protein
MRGIAWIVPNWPTSCRLKEKVSRLAEEIGDRDEMDPVLVIAIGAANFS